MALVTSQSDKIGASSICVNNGGILAEIKERAMQDFIVDTINAKVDSGDLPEAWWIGASADPSNKVWRWTDGKYDYRNWQDRFSKLIH